MPAHADVERLHVREPACPRRLSPRLRAIAAASARRRPHRHSPPRPEHPVGHLPGGAGVRGLLPVPSPGLQGSRLLTPEAAGRGGARRRGDGLSPLLRQPGRPAPGHAARHHDPRRDRRGHLLDGRAPRGLPAPAGAARAGRSGVLHAAPLAASAGARAPLSGPDPPRRSRRRPTTHRHRAPYRGRRLRRRHRVRLGPRRSGPARRPAGEPLPGGGLPGGRHAMTGNMPGPASHTFFSQRLRLHYVDWGNEGKPPLLMIHGGRDHCRNWDWTAAALRDDWHIIAPDLRGHGDSQWSADGSYSMTGYIYDLAQLIHGQRLAPVTIIAHSLGGNVALRYAGLYPETVAGLVAIEGLGPSPTMWAERAAKSIDHRLDEWIREQRGLAGRLPRRYASIEDAFRRMQEENPHLS